MQHPDEGTIHTWLDGELSPEESAAFEAHGEQCEQCKAAIAEARGFVAASSRIVRALDAVPGGVIPAAKPAKRMWYLWYSSAQFRAAAAVLVVATASLLVMRSGTQKGPIALSIKPEANEASSAQRAMPMSSSASATPIRPSAAVGQTGKIEAGKSTTPQVAQSVASRSAAAPKAVATKEQAFRGMGVAGAPARDTAAIASEPAPRAADAISPRPAALAEERSDLKVIRTDSIGPTRRTTYQSLSGSEVVLAEEDLAPVMFKATAATAERRRVAAAPQNAPVTSNLPAAAAAAVADESKPSFRSINWVDSLTRHRYSLSGRVPMEELEAIKARLLQTKR